MGIVELKVLDQKEKDGEQDLQKLVFYSGHQNATIGDQT